MKNMDGMKRTEFEAKYWNYYQHIESKFMNVSSFMMMKSREHVCDLLEGGDKAFQLREQKYQLK